MAKLTCGKCPLVTYRASRPDAVVQECTCPMKMRGYNVLPSNHECDVPIEDMRHDLQWSPDYADRLQRAIAMWEAEERAL